MWDNPKRASKLVECIFSSKLHQMHPSHRIPPHPRHRFSLSTSTIQPRLHLRLSKRVLHLIENLHGSPHVSEFDIHEKHMRREKDGDGKHTGGSGKRKRGLERRVGGENGTCCSKEEEIAVELGKVGRIEDRLK